MSDNNTAAEVARMQAEVDAFHRYTAQHVAPQQPQGPVYEPIRSARELTQAMASERYRTDAAYREDVQNCLAASHAAGIDPTTR